MYDKIKAFIRRGCTAFVQFGEKHLYSIPVAMGGIVIAMMLFLFYATLNAVGEMNSAIQSLPVIIETEMKKTRDVLQDEANSNRSVIVDQHEVTRNELQRRNDEASNERKETKQAIDKIQKKVAQPIVVPPAKRSKVLGIF